MAFGRHRRRWLPWCRHHPRVRHGRLRRGLWQDDRSAVIIMCHLVVLLQPVL